MSDKYKTENSHSFHKKYTGYILVFATGVLVMFGISKFYFENGELDNEMSSCQGEYYFINPRFKCGSNHVIDKAEYVSLKEDLLVYLDEVKNNGRANLVAIFFRDLESGPTLGINHLTDFVPASLLKLPYSLAVLRLAEEKGKDVLSDKVTITKDSNLNQIFKPQKTVKKGEAYTIEELVSYALAYSDNNAAEALFDYLVSKSNNGDIVLQLYRELGILLPEDPITGSAVNVKQYGSIFRSLYNVSFLNNEFSEKVLSILSQDNFEEGLHRGLPQEVKISHKFAERYLDNGEKQLHDCGIIYYPGNPYLLCVMTKGDDFHQLSDVLGEISEKFYKEVDSRRLVQ